MSSGRETGPESREHAERGRGQEKALGQEGTQPPGNRGPGRRGRVGEAGWGVGPRDRRAGLSEDAGLQPRAAGSHWRVSGAG